MLTETPSSKPPYIANAKRSENLPTGTKPLLNIVSKVGCIALAIILLYSLATGTWAGFAGQIKGDSVLFWIGLFLFLLFIPVSSFEIVRRVAQRISWKYVFIVAVLLRLGWVLFSGVEQVSDFKYFDQMALDILDGKYVINPEKPTGASLFFALHYCIFGYNTIYPQFSIAVLSGIQVLLVYSLIVQATSNRAIAVFSSGLLAVWPEHIIYTNLLGSDVLYGTTVLAAIWLISNSRRLAGYPSASLVFGAGLMLGIAHWIRPLAPLFILISALFLLIDRNTVWGRMRNTLSFVVAVILMIAPIMWLNQSIIGFPSPMLSRQGGFSLLVGTNLASRGQYNRNDVRLRERVAEQMHNPNEHPVVLRDRVAKELGIRRLKKHPVEFLKMAFRYKFWNFWGKPADLYWSIPGWKDSAVYLPFCGIAWLYHMIMILLCGVVILRQSQPKMLEWNAATIYVYAALATTLVHLFLEAQPRYHHTFLPLIAIYAGTLVSGTKVNNLPHKERKRKRRRHPLLRK